MFSFFSSRQRQHERTLATLNKITMDAAERMQQEADRANRRAENAREEMAEEQHSSYMRKVGEVQFLESEYYRLSAELADYKDLAAYWSNSYERARRTANFLVENWCPAEAPDEDLDARQARLKAIHDASWEAMLADEGWPARREKRDQNRIKQRRG